MRKTVFLFLILLSSISTCCSFASEVQAVEYFVAEGGSNNRNGRTPETAWGSIQYAVDYPELQPGDIISILPGVYLERVSVERTSGTQQRPITIRAADPSNKPIIRDPNGGKGTRGFMLLDVSHYLVDSLKFTQFNGIGLTVENQNRDITNITIQNCEFIDGYRDSGHILRVQNRKNFVDGVNRTKKITQVKLLNNYIERGSPCQVENPKMCNEVITLLGNVYNSAIIGNVIKDSENIGINVIGREYEFLWGSPRYIVYDGNTVINNYKPRNDTTNNTTNGLYTDGSIGPVLMQNNTVLFDRSTKPEEANGLLNGVVLNAEPAGASELERFEQFIVRNNYFDTEYFSFNLGINQAGNQAHLERVAVVHNVGINATRSDSNASILLSALKDFAFKNNIVVKEAGNTSFVNSKTSTTRNSIVYDWSAKMNSQFVPTWEFDGNQYYHPAGAGQASFKFGTNVQVGFQNHVSNHSVDQNSVFAEPRFVAPNTNTLDGHRVQTPLQGVPLTKTVGSGTNTNRVRLADSKYFFDGFDIVGMQGDKIMIGNQQVRVIDVDYEATDPVQRNTITIDRQISYSGNEPVRYDTQTSTAQIGLLPKSFFSNQPGPDPTPGVTPEPTPEPTPDVSPTPTPAPNTGPDYDNNGEVDIFDYNRLVGAFGSEVCEVNLQGSCEIDIFDFNILVSAFGSST